MCKIATILPLASTRLIRQKALEQFALTRKGYAMSARIYQPARNAMQSGQGNTHHWILEFAPQSARVIDPLMGWTSSKDMNSQVKLRFECKDDAIAYAKKHGLAYQIIRPKRRDHNLRQGGYGENFATNRRTVWTH